MELCVRTSGSLDRVVVLGPALFPGDIESTAIILHNEIKHQRSLETTMVYWRLPWYYQSILEITRVYWRLPGFTGD